MAVFGLFALLAINSVYLAGITLAEWFSAATYQDYFYQWMFLVHLVLGLVIVLPVIVYGIIHINNARHRPNRRAIKVGFALFAFALVLLASGLVLTRGLPYLEVRDPAAREMAYWVHVIVPLLVVWLFILHRLAGKGINWKAGGAVALVAVSLRMGVSNGLYTTSLTMPWLESGLPTAESRARPARGTCPWWCSSR